MSREKKEHEAIKPSSRFKQHHIFTYSMRHLSATDRIRFHYALKGRAGKKGIIHNAKAEAIGRAVLLVSEDSAQTVETFLKEWNCVFQKREVFIPR